MIGGRTDMALVSLGRKRVVDPCAFLRSRDG